MKTLEFRHKAKALDSEGFFDEQNKANENKFRTINVRILFDFR
jgi:hypothetical protein